MRRRRRPAIRKAKGPSSRATPLLRVQISPVAWRRCAYGIFFISVVIAGATFRHYGITWDELVQQAYGEYIFKYFASGFKDISALTYLDLYAYGGAFELLAVCVQKFLPLDVYDVRHACGAFAGLMGLVGTYKLAKRIDGARLGVFAMVFLALCPRYWGDMFGNSKDIPFASAFIWALGYLLEIGKSFPSVSRSAWLKFGLAAGVALSVRIGGVLALVFAGADLVWRWHRSPRMPLGLLVKLALHFLGTVLVAWVVMILPWPWAQQHPLNNPIDAFLHFNHAPARGLNLLGGAYHFSGTPPWTYDLHWFSVTLPELQALALLSGAVLAVIVLITAPLGDIFGNGDIVRLTFVVLLPELYISLSGATLHDGMRHSFFVLPPLMVLAAIAFDRLGQILARRRGLFIGAQCAVIVWTGEHLWHMAELHPYEMA